MSSYKTALSQLVSKTGMLKDTWSSEEWKNVAELVTAEDLHDAFKKSSLVIQKLCKLGLTSMREEKTLERVGEKIVQNYGNYFKSVSDFIGFRVNCSVQQIAEKLCVINQLENCTVLIRKSPSNPNACSSYMDNTGKYVDIIQYVYIYFHDIGHIVELQIGHVFASYTFQVDSEIRNQKVKIEKLCKQGFFVDSKPLPVDLWKNDFYTTVKNVILAKANNEPVPTSMKEIWNQVELLFRGRDIPKELTLILSKLE